MKHHYLWLLFIIIPLFGCMTINECEGDYLERYDNISPTTQTTGENTNSLFVPDRI